jgi:two-component system, sensor histidine kinase
VQDELEDAVLAQSSRLEGLLEFAPFGLLRTNSVGTIVEANRAVSELLGVPLRRLHGKPIAAFIPESHRRSFRRTLLELVHTQTTAEWEFELEARSGRRFQVQLNVAPAEGRELSWVVQDISERVESENRLRTLASALEERVLERTDELEGERARLTAIVDQMPGGVVIAEAPSGRLLIVNERARMLLEIGEGESLHGIERGYKQDGSQYAPEETPIARALAGETVSAERVEVEASNGKRFVLAVRAAPVRDRAGRITAAVSMLEDITEREARDRAERDFVTNAAHELQSPLAAITSAIEVLQAGAKDGTERDLFLAHIERESRRLDRLTRALLILARAQVDVEAPQQELIDLCPLLDAIAERAEPGAGVEISVDCPVDLAVISNRALLEQAISNVVRNSVKYTKSGSIQLIAKHLEEEEEEDVVIAVRDTGPGIPTEALPRVAERFYRASDAEEGFGLGLAIVDAAMKVLGGSIEIASSVDYGTTVALRLPTGATRVRR